MITAIVIILLFAFVIKKASDFRRCNGYNRIFKQNIKK